MYDNKVRLSPDVIEKAQLIAQEWGLKNARAAVEAVFRRYSDEYLQASDLGSSVNMTVSNTNSSAKPFAPAGNRSRAVAPAPVSVQRVSSACDALDALDDLLAM